MTKHGDLHGQSMAKIILKEVAKIIVVVVKKLLSHLGIVGHGDHPTKLSAVTNAVAMVNDC